jgi:phage-related protein
LLWVGTSLERLRAFPAGARREAGYQLFRVQSRLEPVDWKPMPAVGSGVVEIRIHERGEFRILYVARFEEAVYVLHAFSKKTQKTRVADLELAKRNLVAVIDHRGRG